MNEDNVFRGEDGKLYTFDKDGNIRKVREITIRSISKEEILLILQSNNINLLENIIDEYLTASQDVAFNPSIYDKLIEMFEGSNLFPNFTEFLKDSREDNIDYIQKAYFECNEEDED